MIQRAPVALLPPWNPRDQAHPPVGSDPREENQRTRSVRLFTSSVAGGFRRVLSAWPPSNRLTPSSFAVRRAT
jgi:hypothetical protein